MNHRENKKTDAPIVVVTGAGSGIGSAVVHGLLEYGCHAAASDISLPALRALEESVKNTGRLHVFEMDVGSRASVEKTAQDIRERFGGVDVLVNNAGIIRRTPVLRMEEEDMREILNVNLQGTLRCTAVFGSIMARRGQGRIINISSVSGLGGAALASVYAASKAGIIAATRSAARELADKGITVNAVAPGYCDTPMMASDKKMIETFVVPKIPVKRTARPEEVAEVVVFLATCKTGYLTGSIITMDGGINVC